MVTEYKVIKPFAGLEEGDVLSFDKETNNYILTEEQNDGNYYFSRQIELNTETVKSYVAMDYLIPLKAAKEEDERIAKLNKFIDQQLSKYEERNKKIHNKYENGRIPTCVKVEHDTVYFNLVKLLNKIKELLNE